MGRAENVWASGVDCYKRNSVLVPIFRCRCTPEWIMKAATLRSLRGPDSSRILPSWSTSNKSSGWMSLKCSPKGLTQKQSGLRESRTVICPATPSSYLPLRGISLTQVEKRVILRLPEVTEDPERLSKAEFEEFAFFFLALERTRLWEIGAGVPHCRWGIRCSLAADLGLLCGRTTRDVSFRLCIWHG